MTYIDENKQYILLPVYIEGLPLKSKILFGGELLKEFSEGILIQALDLGKTINVNGNDYFLDEKIGA